MQGMEVIMESPLDLTDDIDILTQEIESLEELKPTREARLFVKILILKDRLTLMRRGTGFSGSFTHVGEREIDLFIAA
jgi:hypothetical protein